jgi:Uma2 family endonuclease
VQGPSRLHSYTYADYVGIEQISSTKHEFFDGEIYAMVERTEDHSALAGEILFHLRNALGERPCRVHTSDLRIYVEAVGLATFPDCTVICGPLQQHPPSPNATALNPLVLVEVTNDSSEAYDTTTTVAIRGEAVEVPSLAARLVVDEVYRASALR